MCGIAGCVTERPGEVRSSWLTDMAASISHRGPDDHGFLQWSGNGKPVVGRAVSPEPAQVGLAHLRLAILDLTEAGWQPMRSRDDRFHLVYNGEIYNYLELRDELQRAGHTFHSSGDSEVLLTAFKHWGLDALPKLVGMFAFAALDTERRTVTIARDPFGIKPLYYSSQGGMFAFASEIKALLQLPSVSRSANIRQVYRYLKSGALGGTDATFFAGIRQLAPGHYATISIDRPDRVEPARFWSPPTERDRTPTFEAAAEELRALFVESIRLHLRSDVPIGTALSGGIDSSAIVAAIRAVGGADVDIRTFSFIADDPRLSEESWMDLQAGAAGAAATKVKPPASDLVRDVDRLVGVQDEPFASTSIYAQFRVFELAAASGVKVMLDGQGADEMFAGYPPYVPARISSLLRAGRPAAAVQLSRHATGHGADGPARQLGKAVAGLLHPALRNTAARRFGVDNGAGRWINTQWFADRGLQPEQRPANRTLSVALLRELQV
ncbi:MAG: asparagine synthase (glutamine-hydrolyzing), partial [Actinomycetota bacterium]